MQTCTRSRFSKMATRFTLGNDGGAYVTTQITATDPPFTALNSTLGITQFYPGLSIHPTNASVAIGGTQDNGTVIYSGALTWNDVECGDGGYTAIDFTTPATMYAACEQFNIFKSTSNGMFGSWNAALNGINTGDRVDFIPPLVMDPSNSQKLYFGTDRVYQTTNGAASWLAISPDLTGGDPFFGVISTIAVAPSNSNTVYAGTWITASKSRPTLARPSPLGRTLAQGCRLVLLPMSRSILQFPPSPMSRSAVYWLWR